MKLFDPLRPSHPHVSHLLFCPGGEETEKTLPPISVSFFAEKIYLDILMPVDSNQFRLFTVELSSPAEVAALIQRFIADPEKEILETFGYDYFDYQHRKSAKAEELNLEDLGL